jgi:hypothetical protein
MSAGSLVAFVRESNAIEGIHRDPLHREIKAHEAFLALDEIRVEHLETFVSDVAGASLRTLPGMNVRVGPHLPPSGGPKIEAELTELLTVLANTVGGHSQITPWEVHVEYETLHPFTDGNGRSGRVLWAWQMSKEGRDPFALGFLRAAYYQALEASR